MGETGLKVNYTGCVRHSHSADHCHLQAQPSFSSRRAWAFILSTWREEIDNYNNVRKHRVINRDNKDQMVSVIWF